MTAPSSQPSRAMQIVSVRFGREQIELIQEQAALDGVSASQFIRDSAHARAVMLAAQRNATTIQLFQKLLAVISFAGNDTLTAALEELLANVDVDVPPVNDGD